MTTTCRDCGKTFNPLIERPVHASRCNACTRPKGPDPVSVARDRREREIAAAEASFEEALMNNDPRDIRVEKRRFDKVLGKNRL